VCQNRMKAKAAKTGCPAFATRLLVEIVNRLPGFTAILGDEQTCLRDTGVKGAVRGMQDPDLIDETTATVQLAFEVHLGDEAVMFRIAAVLGAIPRRGFQLLPAGKVVAGKKRHAEIGAVHCNICAAASI